MSGARERKSVCKNIIKIVKWNCACVTYELRGVTAL